MTAVPLRTIPVLVLVYSARKAVNPKLTYEYLAKKCGVSEGYVSMWFSGKRSPSERHATILAKELACELDLIWAKAGTMEEAMEMVLDSEEPIGKKTSSTKGHLRTLPPVEVDPRLRVLDSIEEAPDRVSIPIYPEAIAATDVLRHDSAHDVDLVWIPAAMRKLHGAKLWAIRVAGRSMVGAGIEPGDIVFVRRSSSAKDGDIVVCAHEGGVTIKRLRGDVLVPEAAGYPTIRLGEDARLLGVAYAIHKAGRR